MGKVLLTGTYNRDGVLILITDKSGIAEGRPVTVLCDEVEIVRVIRNGKTKIWVKKTGIYKITANGYDTMLDCPIFGNYEIDLCDGTLVVSCMDSGGNGLLCQVRSCDDSYNYTFTYDKILTFGRDLKLIYNGIPIGKYLVTVDNRYCFYAEVTSVKTINYTTVELKQWLYKRGNQCVWNTGGWMQCLTRSLPDYHTSETRYCQYYAGTSFNVNSMYMRVYGRVEPRNTSGSRYIRDGITADATVGTKQHIKDMKLYKSLVINQSCPEWTRLDEVTEISSRITIRTGEVNNNSTAYTTGTILWQTNHNNSSANTLSLSSINGSASVLLSVHTYTYKYTDPTGNPGIKSGAITLNINEIYLV